MLHVAGLLQVGGKQTTCSDAIWKQYLREFDIGDGGATGAAEATECKVDINLLIETRLRPRGENRQKTHFVRLGNYKVAGETTTASGQLKAGIRPPCHERELKSAQRKLAMDLAPILEKYRNTRASMSASDWVKWSAIDEYSLFLADEQYGNSDGESKDSESEAETEVGDESEAEASVKIVGNKNSNTLVSTNSTINDVASFPVASQPSPPASQMYPPEHPNSKFRILNSLNRDLMDRSSGSQGIQSRALMDALLCEISEFKDSIGEPMGFDSINSKKKVNLVQVPIAKEDAFYGKAIKVGLMTCS
jgi:hypothetical protein